MYRILIFTAFLLSLSLNAQTELNHIDTRRGSFNLSLGTEYRITPIYNLANLGGNRTYFTTWVDTQNAGSSLQYGFDYFITKNLSLNLMNSIRYDLITLNGNDIQGDNGFQAGDKNFIFGFHFFMDYHFKVFRKSELFVRVGKSLINHGTEYNEKRTFFDDNNQPILIRNSTEHYAMQPWNFGIGYKKNKLSIVGGVYTTSITPYFDDGRSFIIPYFNLRYNLFKL